MRIWVRYVARMGEMRNACILVGKSERKKLLERSMSTWEVNIKINFEVTVCEAVDWIRLAQERVSNLRVL
jgi:hypothetical protein